MKVIDLLNKIANGEEVPKKIKWCGVIFNYVEEENYEDYINSRCCSLFEHLGDKDEIYKVTNMLNDEVEIIEEDKKIEKIELEDDGNTISLICKKKNEWTILDNVELEICNKINEIIDYLDKGE